MGAIDFRLTAPLAMASLQVSLIGDGLMVVALAEMLERRGHRIAGVFLSSPGRSALLRQRGVRLAEPEVTAEAFLLAEPCDLLVSANNPLLLSEAVIAHPRLGAVNYHDGPLPAYAGLRASAWAVHNREPRHGITWHRVAAGIDVGDILIQRFIDLRADETAASLNETCTRVALEAFGDLLTKLERWPRRLTGKPQVLSRRSYFSRQDVLPRAGIVDFSADALDIVAAVRSAAWGPGGNDFGTASVIAADGRCAFVTHAEPVPNPDAAPPGTVLAAEGGRLAVACGGGAVSLGLRRMGASPFATGDRLQPISEGDLSAAIRIHRRALLQEAGWIQTLAQASVGAPMSGGDPAPGEIRLKQSGAPDLLRAAQALLGDGALAAVEAPSPVTGAAGALFSNWAPLLLSGGGDLAERLADCRSSGPMLADITFRRPQLHRQAGWEARQRLYLVGQKSPPADLPPAAVEARVAGCDLILRFIDTAGAALAREIEAGLEDERENLARARALAAIPCALGAGQTAPEPVILHSLLDAFGAQVAAQPDAIAIEDGAKKVSYAALDRWSDTVAANLMGLASEGIVVLLIPRSAEFVAAALGVLKAGGSYLPLDPKAPSRRLAFQLEDCAAEWMITVGDNAQAAAGWRGTLLQMETLAGPDAKPAAGHTLSRPSQRAYLIYTSGSTGLPKAAEISHGALNNLIDWHRAALSLGPSDRALMLSNVTFDASVADIWPPLCAGSTLVAPPDEIATDPDSLIAWLADHRVTTGFISTAMVDRMLTRPWPRTMALRYLMTGGDTLHRRPSPGMPFALINCYGPTENTVDSIWSVVACEPAALRPPIGKPLRGVTAYVLDETLRPVPAGREGELVLGGAQVGRGYLNRPDLTAARFVTDPFTPGGRLYRTGDRARWNPDGELEFLGRLDHQIQVHGQRIELGEIEAVIRAVPGVREAVCTPILRQGMVVGTTAHVVPRAGVGDLTLAVRAHLAAELPAAMAPRAIRMETHLPRTSGDKPDRAALQASAGDLHNPIHSTDGELVETARQIWSRLTPTGAGSVDAGDFWSQGGDSLGAVDLLLELEGIVGERLLLSDFLTDPTFGGLTRLLLDANVRETRTVLTLREGDDRPAIACLYGMNGDIDAYLALVEALPEGQGVIGVRSAALKSEAEVPATLEIAAAQALEALREYTDRPIDTLVGYSFGGLLAFESARQLAAAGQATPTVVMVGSTPPAYRASRSRRALHFLRWLPLSAWRLVSEPGKLAALGGVTGLARRVIELFVGRSETPDATASPYEGHKALTWRLALAYRPPAPVPVAIDLIRERPHARTAGNSLGTFEHFREAGGGWTPWTATPPTVHWIDTPHSDAMGRENAGELAGVLTAVLKARRQSPVTPPPDRPRAG